MKPGRELDALVAEKVMGLKRVRKIGPGREFSGALVHSPDYGSDQIGSYDLEIDVPRYSTDIAAAWEVRDRIASRLFSVRQRFTEGIRRLISEEMESEEGLHHSEVILRVKPHHICLAALKAVGQ